jgi:glycine oxidase
VSLAAHSPIASVDVAVVGGGAIGLSVAWRCAQRGASVALLDAGPLGGGASRVAAGMLAPVSEAEYGPAGRYLLELGLASLARWPAFAAELAAASATESRLRETGTMIVARDRDAAEALERERAFRASRGLRVERLRPSEARRREPALAPTVRMALEAPNDNSVDPVWLLDALATAARSAGADLRPHSRVALELDAAGERVTGLRTANGERAAAATVVVAGGAWSAGIEGLPDRASVPVRPVKGQILSLREPVGGSRRDSAGVLPGDPQRTELVRRSIRFEGGYLVPRGDGRYVLGATVEERGFDVAATAGGVYELLRDAAEVLPDVLELELDEVQVGLRPGTPDNVPLIGAGALEGLVWATGHYRNGILLTPITSELVADLVAGTITAPPAGCDPLRFADRFAHAEVPA